MRSVEGMQQRDEQDRDYQAGYHDMMRLRYEAERRGWPPLSPRQMIAEIMWLERSAEAVQRNTTHGLPVLGTALRPANWYRGRADAIRAILHDIQQQQEH